MLEWIFKKFIVFPISTIMWLTIFSLIPWLIIELVYNFLFNRSYWNDAEFLWKYSLDNNKKLKNNK